MNPPTLRAVYLTDAPDSRFGTAGSSGSTVAANHGRPLPAAPLPLPLPLLGAIGERVASAVARLQEAAGASAVAAAAELGRLQQFGLQLQELAHVVARAQQLRQENVDLGIALLQSVAEWSTEAARRGVDLHGPACSEVVQANPAVLKHLLDLAIEHALQQGRSVRLLVELPGDGQGVRMVAAISSEPAAQCPARDTLAWQLLQWLAQGLGLRAERETVPRGERVAVWLPRG